MKREYSYLVAGWLLVDLLKEKGIVYSKEDLRHFNIGLLNIAQTPEMSCDFKLNKISNPYYMGYYFHIWLNKETDRSVYSVISEQNFSIESKHEHEAMRKYKLSFPDILPFFAPGKNVKFENYIRINSELKDKIDITIVPNLSQSELKWLDDELILLMNLTFNFYYEHEKKISFLCKKLYVKNKNKSYLENSEWNADEMQFAYYRKRWIEICESITSDIKKENTIAFFDGILQELDDINSNGNRNRNLWKKEDEKIIKTSSLITIISGFVTFFSTAEEFSSDDDIISIFNEIIENSCSLSSIISFSIKFLGLVTPVIVTVVSAYHTYLVQKSEREDHRETWLRHRLYYSKLVMEIEKFCSRSGDDYKEIENSSELLKCINKFQENINKLKKEDYANFFKNMDCINYDPND